MTSVNRENRDEDPAKLDEIPPEKPKSSPARKIVLLLLLVATFIVFGLDFLPEDESETNVVGPAKRPRSPAQVPSQPQYQQQPATPQQPQTIPQRPKTTPTPAPLYERPPTTVFVSSSPSDLPPSTQLPQSEVGALSPGSSAAPLAPRTAQTDPAAAAGASTDPGPAIELPTEPTTTAAAPAEMATAETLPVNDSPAATSVVEVGTAETPIQQIASRSPTPLTVPTQEESGLVISQGESETHQAAARSLPEGSVPVKVTRYAKRMLQHYDGNNDGVIDTAEQRQMQGSPSLIDYNADGSISLEELAAYTADFGRHRRMRLTGSMLEEAVAELPPLYIPTAQREAQAAAAQKAAQQAQAVPVSLVDQSPQQDLESADDLQSAEGEESGEPAAADESGQAQAAAEQDSSKRFVTPKSRLQGLPQWFLVGDANGDGQLTVAEYAPNSEKTRLADFARYDRNNDGVLTPQECPKD